MKKLFMIVLALTLSGCASMMNGDTQTIILKTYTIPAKVTVKKSQNDIIVTTIPTECIISTKTVIPSKLDEWVYGNVATLGLGLIEDLEGPAWKYDDVYTVKVKRDNACINNAKKLNEELLNLHQ